MRVVPIAAALWAAHALAQAPTPAAQAPATGMAPTVAPAPVPADVAPAPAPAPADVAPAAPAATPPQEEPLHWGVMVDAGIPDGAGAAAIFRPMTWLRLSAGGTYNFVGAGVRGGVSVVPFYFPFSPSLNLEVGHSFSGDATAILERALANSGFQLPDNRLLRQVAYDYANGHLGLELGVPKTFIFFLRLGISYIQTTLKGFEQLVQETAGGTGPPDTSITARDLKMRLTAPSLKLGLIFYF